MTAAADHRYGNIPFSNASRQEAGPQLAEPARRPVRSDLDADVRAYLEKLSDEQLGCLAYGHPWPRLRLVRGKLPKGFSAVPSAERRGVFLVTESCPECSKKRFSLTLPQGIFDRDVHRAYDTPAGWEVRPEGSRLTRRDFMGEIYRRAGHALLAAGGSS